MRRTGGSSPRGMAQVPAAMWINNLRTGGMFDIPGDTIDAFVKGLLHCEMTGLHRANAGCRLVEFDEGAWQGLAAWMRSSGQQAECRNGGALFQGARQWSELTVAERQQFRDRWKHSIR